jgi:hypothetical protein
MSKLLCTICGDPDGRIGPNEPDTQHNMSKCSVPGSCPTADERGIGHHWFRPPPSETIGGTFEKGWTEHFNKANVPLVLGDDADDWQMTTDPELKAMEKIREALEPLDSVERGRVIDWAMERFGL